MLDLGARLCSLARVGDVITLSGDLGAGKTVLARGFIRKAVMPDGETGVPDGGAGKDFNVPSPTFTLAQVYEAADFSVWHFDFYRIESPSEVRETGFEEALDEGVSLIEWPERAPDLLPDARLDVKIEIREASDTRDVTLRPGPSWAERLMHV